MIVIAILRISLISSIFNQKPVSLVPTMAALRTTRLLASSRPLFTSSVFARSYATVDPISKVSEATSASSKVVPESQTSTVKEPAPSATPRTKTFHV